MTRTHSGYTCGFFSFNKMNRLYVKLCQTLFAIYQLLSLISLIASCKIDSFASSRDSPGKLDTSPEKFKQTLTYWGERLFLRPTANVHESVSNCGNASPSSDVPKMESEIYTLRSVIVYLGGREVRWRITEVTHVARAFVEFPRN